MEEKRDASRLAGLDALKGLACLLVVLVHFAPTGEFAAFGRVLNAVSRFSVPVFFATSGYFLAGKDVGIRVREKITRILRLMLRAGLFYALFDIAFHLATEPGFSLIERTHALLWPSNVVKLLVNNNPIAYEHLWFLPALAYCYAAAGLLLRGKGRRRWLLALAPLCAVQIVLDAYSRFVPVQNTLLIPGTGSRMFIYNCFLFRAMPFFAIGMLMREYGQAKPPCGREKCLLLLGAVLGTALAAVEYRVTGRNGQCFFGSVLAFVCLFRLAIGTQRQFPLLARIGRELSLPVYILHVAIGKTCELLLAGTGISEGRAYCLLRPLCITAVSLFAAWAFVRATKKTPLHIERKN